MSEWPQKPLITAWKAMSAAIGIIALLCITIVVVMQIRDTPVPNPQGFDAKAIEMDRLDAQRLVDAGEYLRAVPLAENVVHALPDDADARFLLADALLGSRCGEEAYEQAVAGLDLREDAAGHFFAGILAGQILRWNESEQHLAKAQQLEPNASKHTLHRAQALLELKRLKKALLQAEQFQVLEPGMAESYILLARIHDEMRHEEQSLQALERGFQNLTSFNPQRHALTIYKAKLFRRKGKIDDAIGLLASLPPKHQQSEAATDELARCYLQKGNPKKAAALWGILFVAEPLNARAAGEAAKYFLKAKDRKNALSYFQAAYAIDPNHPLVMELEKEFQNENQ